MSSYYVRFGADTITVDVGPQAQDPILIDGEPTQWQTADARHRADWAILLACRATWPEEEWPESPEGGSDPIAATEAWEAMEYVEVEDAEDEQAHREMVDQLIRKTQELINSGSLPGWRILDGLADLG